MRDEGHEDVDPEQVRDQIFAAVRLLVQLLAEHAPRPGDRGHPLGRRGHARPDRAPRRLGARPGADRLPGARRAPRAAADLGRRQAQRHDDLARPPLRARRPRTLVALAAGRRGAGGRAGRGGRRPLRRQPAVRRGDGQPASRGGERRRRRAARQRPRGAGGAPRRARGRRAPPAAGRLGDRPELLGQGRRRAGRRGRSVDRSLAALVEKDLLAPSTASRVAGEREFSFKHALVRDVAYATLPRAVRARQHFELAGIIEGRLGANREGVAALLAEHHGRAAALAEQAGFPAEELRRMRVGAAQRLRVGRRRWRRRCTRTPRPSPTTRARCAVPDGLDAGRAGPGRRRAAATRRFARATSMPRSRAGREALEFQRGRRRPGAGRRSCTARSARASGTRRTGSRRSPSSSRESTCSRTASPAGS